MFVDKFIKFQASSGRVLLLLGDAKWKMFIYKCPLEKLLFAYTQFLITSKFVKSLINLFVKQQ